MNQHSNADLREMLVDDVDRSRIITGSQETIERTQ